MLKNKFFDAVFAVLVMVSLVSMYAFIPGVKASGLDSAKTTLSDSDMDATATSTIVVDLNDLNPLTGGMFFRVSYDDLSAFTGFSATIPTTCPTNTTASTTYTSNTNRVIECVVDTGAYLAATSSVTYTIVIGKHINPSSENDYSVSISTHGTYASGAAEVDYANTKVYILDAVEVSARVPASLTFSVDGIGPYSTRDGFGDVTLSGTSTALEINFGTLDTAASSTYGHEITVSTNATDGYSVTVQQTAELTNGAGDTINSFNNQADGSGTLTPDRWHEPTAVFGSAETYGHMGVTADDATNMSINYAGGLNYVGLDGEDPVQVMSHNGPSNSTGEGQGIAGVFYTAEISDLQEAGDYTSTLTYVRTPTY